MSKTRTWGVIALLTVAAVLAAGWFLALSPQKAKVSKLHASAAQEATANRSLQSQIALLKKQQAQIPAEQARIAVIKGRIPPTPALTDYVRTLTSLAAATNVELVSIAPAAPALVQVAGAPPAPAAAAPAAGAPAASSSATGALSLSAIKITVNVVGDYYSVQQFLSKLENTSRVTMISTVSLAPGQLPQPQGGGPSSAKGQPAGGPAGADWKTLTAQITVSVFMSPTAATGGAAGAAATPVNGAAVPAAPAVAPAAPAASKPAAPAAANK